jgi:peptide/nickel transport system substrate-binding protein
LAPLILKLPTARRARHHGKKRTGLFGFPAKEKNRAEARTTMESFGYRPDHRLKVKVSARNIAIARDPAVILIDQLKTIYIDGELDLVDSAVWFPKLARRDYAVALGLGASAVDDPDQQFYQNYACGSELNVTGYCNHEIETLFDRQSSEADQQKRKQLVWQIDERLQQDDARPIIYYNTAATCWQPDVKGLTIMVNSIYNGWRMEDVWLDR